GFHELANFLDFKMPYAGVPQTVSKSFRDRNRKTVEDYMTAVVEGMQIFRTNKETAYKAIFELTRQKDPALLERTYDSYAKQYDAIGGIPVPWEAGIESMITGFHERFNPQGIKNHDPKTFLHPSFVQKAEGRLRLEERKGVKNEPANCLAFDRIRFDRGWRYSSANSHEKGQDGYPIYQHRLSAFPRCLSQKFLSRSGHRPRDDFHVDPGSQHSVRAWRHRL